MQFVTQLGLTIWAMLGTPAAGAPTQPSPRAEETKVQVIIRNTFGKEPLQLNRPYTTLSGDVVEFTRFAYYLSNLRLRSQDGTVWQAPDSYHLLETAEDDPTAFTLALTDLPAGEYNEVSFAVDLDSVVNHGPNRKGVLNPDFGMFWEWESDYVFLKCEGYFQRTAQDRGAFVYHVAGDQTYRAVRLKLAPGAFTVAAGQPKTLGITTDARQLFGGFPGGALTLQLTQPDPTTSIMAGGNATKLADNYARMFAVENIATY